MAGEYDVLHVDDDTAVGSVTATALEREDGRLSVRPESDPATALDRLATEGYDCVVSDYQMPSMDGLELLERVRESHPDLPFILFTGAGSEAIASEAIARGVTDYLQKGTGRDQYAVLANRITNAIDRTAAQASLRESESHLRQAQSVADLGSWQMDVERDDIHWSDEVFEIFDRPRDAGPLDFEAFLSYVHPDDVDFVREEWERALAGATYDIEHRIVVDDETRWVRERAELTVEGGEPTSAIGVVQDITDRKRREEQLRAERDRRGALFENATDCIAYTEFEDGTPVVREVNPAFEQTFGYAADEIDGRPLDELIVPPERRDEVAAINDRALAGDRVESEVERVTADGTRRHFLLRSVPLDPGTTGRRSYAVYADITDRKEYERRLERQNERLDEFASVVSHDLRGPLNVLSGRLQLLREDVDDARLDAMADAVDRMDDIVERTLLLARRGRAVGDAESVDLEALARESWRAVETDAAALRLDALPDVEGDPERLRHVFENLFRNSVEHGSTDDGSASPPAAGDVVQVRVGALPDGRGFFVADDGAGVPEAARARVFEPGYTTVEDGNGFGLAICREIVEAHGWELRLDDDDGARFEVVTD